MWVIYLPVDGVDGEVLLDDELSDPLEEDEVDEDSILLVIYFLLSALQLVRCAGRRRYRFFLEDGRFLRREMHTTLKLDESLFDHLVLSYRFFCCEERGCIEGFKVEIDILISRFLQLRFDLRDVVRYEELHVLQLRRLLLHSVLHQTLREEGPQLTNLKPSTAEPLRYLLKHATHVRALKLYLQASVMQVGGGGGSA